MPIPDTIEGLKKAGYRFKSRADCRGCDMSIEWWVTPKGRNMPFSVVYERVSEKFTIMRRRPHWGDCRNAAKFRRGQSQTASNATK